MGIEIAGYTHIVKVFEAYCQIASQKLLKIIIQTITSN